MTFRFPIGLLFLFLAGGFERVAEAQTPTGEAPVTASTAPGLDISNKRPLTGKKLEDKRQGGYFTGLPLLNSDPDKGIGYGVRVYYFLNGHRTDPLFAYAPYVHRIYLQYFAATNGYQYHVLNLDSPYLGGSAYRLRAALEYDRNTATNFYGVGVESLAPLRRNDQLRSFSNADDFEIVNRRVIAGTTYARYNQYELFKPALMLSLERDIWGGVVRPLAGIGISKVSIVDYSGKRLSVDGVRAISRRTKLAEEQAAGKLIGFDGGWTNRLTLGAAYDTRDFEPDPKTGMYHEVLASFSNRALGSAHSYERYSTTLRFYTNPVTALADIVVALRGFYRVQTGSVPFYEMSALPFIQENENGLGGLRSLRGYRQNRFVGPVIAMGTLEFRWTVTTLHVYGNQFAPILVPFVDTGRVFDQMKDTALHDWKYSGGAGLHLAWNQASIVVVDYGVSPEGTGLYINFNHNF